MAAREQRRPLKPRLFRRTETQAGKPLDDFSMIETDPAFLAQHPDGGMRDYRRSSGTWDLPSYKGAIDVPRSGPYNPQRERR